MPQAPHISLSTPMRPVKRCIKVYLVPKTRCLLLKGHTQSNSDTVTIYSLCIKRKNEITRQDNRKLRKLQSSNVHPNSQNKTVKPHAFRPLIQAVQQNGKLALQIDCNTSQHGTEIYGHCKRAASSVVGLF
uniref:Uncharacterized protein n=1 Tax=Anguilla anguilla TaxID=7936 RepID=A0A0E9X5P7_ANGAN